MGKMQNDNGENMTPYFSIVMPAYGVEKYIRRAIEHIQNQTFADWELIVVDDAAVDRSGEIAEEMAAEDARIRVIHHEVNQGLGPARNTGMREATGKYIWFPDSDDWVEGMLLADAHASLEKDPAKVLVFGLHEEYFRPGGEYDYEHVVKPEKTTHYDRQQLRREVIHLEQAPLYGYAWNKIYDRAYLASLQLFFEKVTLIEDIVFNVSYFIDIDGMNTLAIAPYHYGKRMDANLCNKFVPDYYKLHRRRIQLLYDQYEYWNLLTPEVEQIIGSLYGRYILSTLERNCDPQAHMSHKTRARWCARLFREPLFTRLIPKGRATGSRTLSIALSMLRQKSIPLCLLMGRGIYIVRQKLPMLYTRTRSGR